MTTLSTKTRLWTTKEYCRFRSTLMTQIMASHISTGPKTITPTVANAECGCGARSLITTMDNLKKETTDADIRVSLPVV